MSFGKPKDDSIPSSTTSSVVSGMGAVGTNSPQSPKVEVFLGRGSKVVGTLTFSGPVDLDGVIEGEVIAQDRLTIGESAQINAKITGVEILIKGTVNGDITASKKLSLKKPAHVVGNLTSANLSIEEGVIFEGKCMMTSSISATKAADGKPTLVKPIGSEKLA